MGARAYYTIRQARWLLGGGDGKLVDGKILGKWLDEAAIKPQQNPRDKREWRITRTQLEELARKHKITLRDDETLREDVEHALSLSALTVEVEELGQMLEEMQGRFAHMQEALIEDWRIQLERATRQVVTGLGEALREQFSQLPQLQKQTQSLIKEAQEETRHILHEQLAALRKELPQLIHRPETVRESSSMGQANVPSSATASKEPEERVPTPYIPEGQAGSHKVPADLPVGTVSMRSFLEAHGSTRDIMTAAAKRRDIATIARPYGKDGAGTQYFLDPAMQDLAVAWLVKTGYGHACKHCPHVKGTEPLPRVSL